MLAVERRHDLAGVEIGKVDERHFGKPKLFFDLRRNPLHGGLVDAAAKERVIVRLTKLNHYFAFDGVRRKGVEDNR